VNVYRDFCKFDPGKRLYSSVTLGDVWKPRAVSGSVAPGTDFTSTGGRPTFGERAISVLRDFLEPNGELLPILAPACAGNFFVYNTTTVTDALDTSRSQIGVLGLGRYEFVQERLADLSIFRIPTSGIFIYVTDAFVLRAKDYGLEGFNFVQIWPVLKKDETMRQAEYLAPPMRTGRPEPRVQEVRTPLEPAMPSQITFRPLVERSERDAVIKTIADLPVELGVDFSQMTARQVQNWISDRLVAVGASSMTENEKSAQAFWLAFAWGQTLVAELGWEWVTLLGPDSSQAPGVISPDRAYAVAVLSYMKRQVKAPQIDQNSQLLFNMIAAGEWSTPRHGGLRLLG